MGANISRCEYCSQNYDKYLRTIFIKSYREIKVCTKCYNTCFKYLPCRHIDNKVLYKPNRYVLESLKGSLNQYIDEVTNELELKVKESRLLELLSNKYN